MQRMRREGVEGAPGFWTLDRGWFRNTDWHWHAGGWNALDQPKPCEALRGGRESIYHRERTCADEGATRGGGGCRFQAVCGQHDSAPCSPVHLSSHFSSAELKSP